MAIFVPHFGLAKLLGEAQVRSAAPTVRALLAEVRARIGDEKFKAASQAAILVNGRNISYLKGEATPLSEDDQVWMVFPSAGG